MSKQSTIEKQAEVRALLVQGYSSPKIETLTGIPESTVRTWKLGWTEIDAEQRALLDKQSVEIALIYDGVLRKAGEYLLDQDGATCAKHIMAANAAANTPRDKLARSAPASQFNVQVNVGRDRFAATVPGQYQITEEAPRLESPLPDGD